MIYLYLLYYLGYTTYTVLMKYKNKLKNNPPPSFGLHPPWIPIPTYAASNFLGVHPKTLLKWSREGTGPKHSDRDKYTYNQLYWQPGELLEWWELNALGKTRGFQKICEEWCEEVGQDFFRIGVKWERPPKATSRHQRRRRHSKTPNFGRC